MPTIFLKLDKVADWSLGCLARLLLAPVVDGVGLALLALRLAVRDRDSATVPACLAPALSFSHPDTSSFRGGLLAARAPVCSVDRELLVSILLSPPLMQESSSATELGGEYLFKLLLSSLGLEGSPLDATDDPKKRLIG